MKHDEQGQDLLGSLREAGTSHYITDFYVLQGLKFSKFSADAAEIGT